jgi:hypothetical protein
MQSDSSKQPFSICSAHRIPHTGCPRCAITKSDLAKEALFLEKIEQAEHAGEYICDCGFVYYKTSARCPKCGDLGEHALCSLKIISAGFVIEEDCFLLLHIDSVMTEIQERLKRGEFSIKFGTKYIQVVKEICVDVFEFGAPEYERKLSKTYKS